MIAYETLWLRMKYYDCIWIAMDEYEMLLCIYCYEYYMRSYELLGIYGYELTLFDDINEYALLWTFMYCYEHLCTVIWMNRNY